jgi:hypothetical protein
LTNRLTSLFHNRADLGVRPLDIHPKTRAPTGREQTRTGQPPDRFVSQTVRRASTTFLQAMS